MNLRTVREQIFSKYDIWTLILENKILDKCYMRLNKIEKKNYNDFVFSKIRSITRYTYPETVNAKNRLEKKKILKIIKDKIIKITENKHGIILISDKNKKYYADIAINVSGPVSINKNKNEVMFINDLKKITQSFNNRGFLSNNNFQIYKNIFAPGTISSNFNPNRKTIIKSITENCNKVANHISN